MFLHARLENERRRPAMVSKSFQYLCVNWLQKVCIDMSVHLLSGGLMMRADQTVNVKV